MKLMSKILIFIFSLSIFHTVVSMSDTEFASEATSDISEFKNTLQSTIEEYSSSSQNFNNIMSCFFESMTSGMRDEDDWYHEDGWDGESVPKLTDEISECFYKSFDQSSTFELPNLLELDFFQIYSFVGERIKGNTNLIAQNLNLELGDKLLVVGDLHGFYDALVEVLTDWFSSGYINKRLKLNRNVRTVFLGDYVDRGPDSLKVLIILMTLKIINPENVFILRGNHEELGSMLQYGFSIELFERFSIDAFGSFIAWNNCCHLLSSVLFARYRTGDDWCTLQLNHGGVQNGYNPLGFIRSNFIYENIFVDEDVLNGFHWNDIYPELGEDFISEVRGPGTVIHDSKYVIRNYLKQLNISGIVKGHQHVAPKIYDLYNFLDYPDVWKKIIDPWQFDQLLEDNKQYFRMNTNGFCNIGSVENPILITIATSPYRYMNYRTNYLEIEPSPESESGWDWSCICCS